MKKLVGLMVGVVLAIVATLLITVNPVLAQGGSAVITVEGKPVDLKKLTTDELVQLADLINKAAGKTPVSVKKSEATGLIDVNFITRDEGPTNLCYPPVCSLFGLFCC